VRNEGTVTAAFLVPEHRNVTRKRSSAVISDERGEAMALDESRQLEIVLNPKCAGNVHG
jgi:hypothetical protein